MDGHHRYKIFKKHNIEFNIEEISLPKDSEKSDVMDWMITYQDVRRNMCEAEKIYANDKVSARRIENEKKRLSTLKQNQTANRSLQLEASDENNRDLSLNTDRQTAQKAGVSAGTVARYNKVMNSNEEDLKEKVKTEQVAVNKAYEEVRKRETRV